MKAKILVTGATGVVGSNIIKTLVRNNIAVRASVHKPEKTNYIKAPGVEAVKLEFGDFATIDAALQGIETLLLITPFAREQVEFARRMIDRALLFGVEHIIDLSIMGAQQEPGTQFSRWHRRVEKYIQHSTNGFTIVRPNVYMQNFLRYLQPFGGFSTCRLIMQESAISMFGMWLFLRLPLRWRDGNTGVIPMKLPVPER